MQSSSRQLLLAATAVVVIAVGQAAGVPAAGSSWKIVTGCQHRT